MGISTSESIVERRTKLLNLEGDGHDRPEIVKQLSKEFQVSERTIARDFQIRKEWQPQLTNHSDRIQAFHSILNRFEQIYKKSSFLYLHAKNENIQVASLKIMLDTLAKIKDLVNISKDNQNDEIKYSISWQDSSVVESLKKQNSFNEWAKENLTTEQQSLVDEVTRFFVKYELQQSKTEEGIH